MKNLRLLVACFLISMAAPSLFALDLYVSPGGSDANSGSSAQPFATLTGARDALRNRRAAGSLPNEAVTVYLGAGYYNQTATAAFTAADSGSSSAPVTFASVPGQQAYITGAVSLDPHWFSLVDSSSPIWGRLDPAAQGNVYAVNLWAHGIGDLGSLQPRGYSLRAAAPLELYCNGQTMTLARWPNVGQTLPYTVSAASSTQFGYSGNRASRWTQASNIWVHGFWSQNYADYHLPVASIDTVNLNVNLALPPAQFGLAGDRPYYVYNLLEELDTPGEYYVDRSTGMLYFWPQTLLAGSVLQVSMMSDPVISLSGASNLTFRNLIIEATRGPLVNLTDGDHNQFENCLLRNAGEYGAFVTGSNNGLDHSQIAFCGEEGVRLQGGDRPSLTNGNNYVSNSQIHAIGQVGWGYRPAVAFEGGCGNSATHNLIDDLPHAAVIFTGNNHLISYNEISRVCQLTSDSSAIYSGRSWAYRGNLIEYNYLHDIASTLGSASANGVYLDDCLAGVTVFSNVFYNISGTAIFTGGGRDNLMSNNVIALSGTAHYDDDRGMVYINNTPGDSWNLLEALQTGGIQYQQYPWANQYPACAALPNSWDQLQQGEWRDPQNSVFSSNVGWSNFAWTVAGNYAGTPVFAAYASFENNNSGETPLFTAAAALDRNLRPGTLNADVAGFASLPFSSIGPDNSSLPAPTGAPAAPVLSGLTSSASQVGLDWSTLAGFGMDAPTGISVQEADGSGNWNTVQSYGAAVDFTSVAGLSAGTTYSFRVVASNGSGSSVSNTVSLTTSAAPPSVVSSTQIGAASPLNVVNDVGSNGTVGVSKGILDSGAGSVRMYDVGDAIRIDFSVSSNGLYQLGLRVRSGGAVGPTGFWPSGYLATLDGTALPLTPDDSSLSAFDPSFGGCIWGTMNSAALNLTAGNHSVVVTSEMAWAVVNYLQVSTLSTSTSTPAPSTTVTNSSSASTGTSSPASVMQVVAATAYSVINDVGIDGTVGVAKATLDSAAGSVRMYDVGDAIEINFTTSTPGTYQIGLRARAGGTSGPSGYWPDGYQLQLDGSTLGVTGDPNSISAFDPLYGGCYWGTMNTGSVTLAAGTHSVIVSAELAWAVVDYLQVTRLAN